MSDRDALLSSMAEARAQLTAVTDQLAHRLDDVADSDGMRVRDLLAHFAGWQRVATRRIRTRMADGQIQPIEADDYNPHLLALSRQWSEDEVMWEFNDAYAALVTAVRDAPEAECGAEGYAFRFADRTARTHYPDHLPDLEHLVRAGPMTEGPSSD
jgi:hypothetical protein